MFDYVEDVDLNLGGLQVYVIPGMLPASGSTHHISGLISGRKWRVPLNMRKRTMS